MPSLPSLQKLLSAFFRLFGSKRILVIVLMAAPVLVFFLSLVAVFELPLMANSQHQLRAEVVEFAVRLAIMLLVFTLLYIPAAWVFQFSRISRTLLEQAKLGKLDPEAEAAARAEFLGWFTAVSVPYLILGFSMTIEFKALLEDTSAGIGAIAAIMVLYALSILSSFLYIEVRELRQNFSKEMRETGNWLKHLSDLASYQTPLGTPSNNVSDLLGDWIKFLKTADASTKERLKLRQNLIGTLLVSYIKEESVNISGNLSPDCTSTWVSEIKKAEAGRGGIAFIATNVGFYAKYLGDAVEGVSRMLGEKECVALAAITYVLPSFWWNWPYASEHHGHYEPVATFRATLRRLSRNHKNRSGSLRVFRRMLVSSGSNDDRMGSEMSLSDRTLNDVFKSTFCSEKEWERMKTWRFILDEKGNPRTSAERAPVNAGELIEEIQWTQGDRPSDGESQFRVFWITNKTLGEIPSVPVIDYYKTFMHPAGGNTDYCVIDFDTFRRPFHLDSPSGISGLNGCPEITFLGVCGKGCNNIWGEKKPRFGVAFLSNMTKGHDSIFLAVITDESLLEKLWKSVCTLKATPL